MDRLLCPVCKKNTVLFQGVLSCENGHCFDTAREGYINLLTGSKAGSLTGDNRDMARNRKSFLDKGYFQVIATELCRIINAQTTGTVLDICCGEGYYSEFICRNTAAAVYGFDLSKEMVRLAAKRKCGAKFFVANMSDIPVSDGFADCAVHLFAPFCEKEFERTVRPGGCLISVCPGKEHLWELKRAIYDTPYENEEARPALPGFELEDTLNIKAVIHLGSNEDIRELFRMTPYYYHTSPDDKAKLSALDRLETTVDFYMRIYRRKREE